MRVLVIGSSGREHAIAWRLSQDENVEEVIVSPGNAGTNTNKIKSINAIDIVSWLNIVEERNIDLTVVGPENILAAGIVDEFNKHNKLIVGPNNQATQIEASKIYCKKLLNNINIPTAKWIAIDNEEDAIQAINNSNPPYVIKADGLAGGKGVCIVDHEDDAILKAKEYLRGKFGVASKRIIIEEYIKGEEYSLIALCDGKNIIPFPLSKDYKRLADNDLGPNTGGMGAVCPIKLNDINEYELCKKLINPIINELGSLGISYQGYIYLGLIIDENKQINVLEINCRLGDPEAQVILPLLASNFTELLLNTAKGDLSNYQIAWQDKSVVSVVLCTKDYPDKIETQEEIMINQLPAPGMIFHAGTTIKDNKLLTAGGRVINVLGIDKNIAKARENAYCNITAISFANSKYRSDIAKNL